MKGIEREINGEEEKSKLFATVTFREREKLTVNRANAS